ncbi:MAG: beta-lactamase family protein [Lachnospiraceae bacterium]|nr:beta-lactamase family protein [Lachnospiraceae bacterium]
MKMIDEQMKYYVDNKELSGVSWVVRKDGQLLTHGVEGYSNLEEHSMLDDNSIFRLMSMTKPVISVAVLQLMEEGKLSLEDPVCKYVPQFKGLKVCADAKYADTPKNPAELFWKMVTYRFRNIKLEDEVRPFTIRDLLSHSSGLGQGFVGLIEFLTARGIDETLDQRIDRFSKYTLGFQPGTGTGYSPVAGFDTLGYIISKIADMSIEDYIHTNICAPLNMTDTTFFLKEEQKNRLVALYKKKGNVLKNVTNSKEDMYGFTHQKPMSFEEGCCGLYSTLSDYDRFAQMLCAGGTYNGNRILKQETVEMMSREGSVCHLEPEPGNVWGLGVKIRQNPETANSSLSKGSYGWSGAYGTHFFVDPLQKISAVLMTNRTDLGGSDSYVSKKFEDLIYQTI